MELEPEDIKDVENVKAKEIADLFNGKLKDLAVER